MWRIRIAALATVVGLGQTGGLLGIGNDPEALLARGKRRIQFDSDPDGLR